MKAEYIHYHNVRIPMRDGVTLAADVYLPDAEGAFPVILNRSPYGGTQGLQATGRLKNGYAVVWVDCRGRFLSEGVCSPWRAEIDDGYDTLEWLAAQPWCDGNVGMVGGSYPGGTQLFAAASGHPALKAIAPSAISSRLYEVYYTHGVLELSFMPPWHIGMCSRDIKPAPNPDWNKVREGFPVCEMDTRAGMPCESWRKVASTPDPDDPFWKQQTLKPYAANMKAPFFIQTSYFDLLGRKGPEIYTDLMNDPATPESWKKYSWMRFGPWGHGVDVKEGEYTFGDGSIVTEDLELDFLDSLLMRKKEPDTLGQPGRIHYFTMGENRWHDTDVWPVEGTVDTPFYLGSGGGANTLRGDGFLSRILPAEPMPADHFTYDPLNPVPTCGGRMVGTGGQKCQSEVEQRKDVLVYTSPALADDLTVTGVIRARLFVSSDAPDTDFTVKIADVRADGRPYNVCDTIYRMRYRNGYARPEMMKPGEICEVEFDVDFTSYMFRKGHAVRVEISSSNFPHYERNLNTEKLPAMETEPRIANQTVHHGPETPSCVILPVVAG